MTKQFLLALIMVPAVVQQAHGMQYVNAIKEGLKLDTRRAHAMWHLRTGNIDKFEKVLNKKYGFDGESFDYKKIGIIKPDNSIDKLKLTQIKNDLELFENKSKNSGYANKMLQVARTTTRASLPFLSLVGSAILTEAVGGHEETFIFTALPAFCAAGFYVMQTPFVERYFVRRTAEKANHEFLKQLPEYTQYNAQSASKVNSEIKNIIQKTSNNHLD